MFTRTCYGSQDRAVRLNAEAFSVRNQVKQLYLGKDTTSKHQTCTVVLLSVYIPNDIPILALESVLGSLHGKKNNPLSDYGEGDMALHSTALLCAQSSNDGERLVCGSLVVGLPNNEERSPKVASGRKCKMEASNTYICPIIAVSRI